MDWTTSPVSKLYRPVNSILSKYRPGTFLHNPELNITFLHTGWKSYGLEALFTYNSNTDEVICKFENDEKLCVEEPVRVATTIEIEQFLYKVSNYLNILKFDTLEAS